MQILLCVVGNLMPAAAVGFLGANTDEGLWMLIADAAILAGCFLTMQVTAQGQRDPRIQIVPPRSLAIANLVGHGIFIGVSAWMIGKLAGVTPDVPRLANLAMWIGVIGLRHVVDLATSWFGNERRLRTSDASVAAEALYRTLAFFGATMAGLLGMNFFGLAITAGQGTEAKISAPLLMAVGLGAAGVVRSYADIRLLLDPERATRTIFGNDQLH